MVHSTLEKVGGSQEKVGVPYPLRRTWDQAPVEAGGAMLLPHLSCHLHHAPARYRGGQATATAWGAGRGAPHRTAAGGSLLLQPQHFKGLIGSEISDWKFRKKVNTKVADVAMIGCSK